MPSSFVFKKQKWINPKLVQKMIDKQFIKKQYFCIDCNEKVSDLYTKRCRKCYLKNNEKKYFCIDCNGQVIDKRTKRCRKCWIEYFRINPNRFLGERNGMWKENVTYRTIHKYINRHKFKPEVCEICGTQPPRDVASKNHIYTRNVDDYQWLCRRCHNYKDGTINNLNCKNRCKKDEKNM